MSTRMVTYILFLCYNSFFYFSSFRVLMGTPITIIIPTFGKTYLFINIECNKKKKVKICCEMIGIKQHVNEITKSSKFIYGELH